MQTNKLPKSIQKLFALMGITTEKLKIENGELNLTEAQKAKLNDNFGDKVPKVMDQLKTIVTALTEAESAPQTTAEETVTLEELTASVTELTNLLKKENTELRTQIDTMSKLPVPITTGTRSDGVAHQAFVEKLNYIPDFKRYLDGNPNHPWMEFSENRPWLKRIKEAMDNNVMPNPYYDTVDITNLSTDLTKFWQMYGSGIISFNQDNRELPSFWTRATGFANEGVWPLLNMGEVSQGRNDSGEFLDKAQISFEDERFFMYPMKIDYKISGDKLQELEKTFIGIYYNINKTSQPIKMDYARFIMEELLMMNRQENNMRSIAGVYRKTKAGEKAGKAINAMIGIIPLLYRHIREKKVIPFNIGKPEVGDYHRYYQRMVAALPEKFKTMQLLIYVSTKAQLQMQDDYRQEFKNSPAPELEVNGETYNYVLGFKNVVFVPLNYIEDSLFCFITTRDNIIVLDGVVGGEGQKLTSQVMLRDLYIMADYKKGIFFPRVGLKKADNSTDYSKQWIWCNNVIEPVNYVVQPVDTVELNTILNEEAMSEHHAMQIGINTSLKTITKINNVRTGCRYFVKGNTGPSALIPKNLLFKIVSDCLLIENLVLELYWNGTFFTELNRYLEVGTTNTKTTLAVNATIANATKGSVFVSSINTQPTVITDITNAVEGMVYRFIGGGGTAGTPAVAANPNATPPVVGSDAVPGTASMILNGGNFRLSADISLVENAWMDVLFQGALFVELNRG